MKNPLILDTNAYYEFLKDVKWQKVIPLAPRVYMPVIVLAELRVGFHLGGKIHQNEDRLQIFLRDKSVDTLSPDIETTHHYARIQTQLRRQGTPIPQNDIWIAALSVQHGLWLCTSDAHFDHLPQLLRAFP